MKRLNLITAALATTAAIALAAPANAQGYSDYGQGSRDGMQAERTDRQGPYSARTGRTVQRDAVAARLVSSSQLLDKQVVSQDGDMVGRVEYLIIDPATGAVTNMLVRATSLDRRTPELTRQGRIERRSTRTDDRTARSDEGGNPLLIMPWHSIDINLGAPGEVVAQAPFNQIRRWPVVGDVDISRITSPRLMAQIIDYYAPVSEQTGQQDNRRAREGRDRQDRERQALAGSGDGQSMRGDRQSRIERQGQTERQDRRQGQQQDGRQARNGADNQPQILVGREIVGVLAPPAITTADQLRGLPVETDTGTQVGEVDMVMINADSGSVDYVLVDQMGAGLVPVAFGDLDLAADAQSMVLDPEGILIGVIMPEDQQQRTAQDRQDQQRGQRQSRQAMGGMDGMRGQGMMGQGRMSRDMMEGMQGRAMQDQGMMGGRMGQGRMGDGRMDMEQMRDRMQRMDREAMLEHMRQMQQMHQGGQMMRQNRQAMQDDRRGGQNRQVETRTRSGGQGGYGAEAYGGGGR